MPVAASMLTNSKFISCALGHPKLHMLLMDLVIGFHEPFIAPLLTLENAIICATVERKAYLIERQAVSTFPSLKMF